MRQKKTRGKMMEREVQRTLRETPQPLHPNLPLIRLLELSIQQVRERDRKEAARIVGPTRLTPPLPTRRTPLPSLPQTPPTRTPTRTLSGSGLGRRGKLSLVPDPLMTP